MAFYIPLTDADGYGLVMMRSTEANPADGDWDESDGVRLLSSGWTAYDNDKIKSIWAFESADGVQYAPIPYLFDASDAGPTDPDTVWTQEANIATDEGFGWVDELDTGSSTSKETKLEGTNAPASGDTIDSVSLTVSAAGDGGSGCTMGLLVQTDGGGETLLNTTQVLPHAGGDSFSEYDFSVSTPSGGWTWAKLQALEIIFWLSASAGGDLRVFRAKAKVATSVTGTYINVVTQQESGRIAYHVYDPGTTAWVVEDEHVIAPGESTNYDALLSSGEPYGVSLAVRGDGDVVVGFAGLNTSSSAQILLIVRTSGSWGSILVASAPGAETALVLVGPDGSDRIYHFHLRNTGTLQGAAFLSGDTFGSAFNVDTIIDTASVPFSPGVIADSEYWVPYIDAANDISVAHDTFADSPGAPTIITGVSSAAVYGHGRTSAPYVAAGLSVDGAVVHCAHIDDSGQEVQHEADVESAGADDALTTGKVAARISSNIV